jgi:hypothetical protein
LSAVLITIQNGTVDYCTDDRDTQVVIVDFDKFDPDTSFPDDVDASIHEVMDLPPEVPWRGGIVKRLNEVKRTINAALLAAPTYAREGNYRGNNTSKRYLAHQANSAAGLPASDVSGEREPQEAEQPVC